MRGLASVVCPSTMAAESPVFVYETLAPIGEDDAIEVANEVLDMSPGFLPLGGGESPREENFVVERQEVTRRGSSTKKVVMTKTTREGRNLETLIAAEKNLLNESHTSENNFKARADTSGSSVLGVQGTLNTYSVSRTNIQSTGFATELGENGDDDETDYISLDLGDGNNVETMVVEEVQEVAVKSKGKEAHATGILNMTPQGAPPWARGRDTWIQSPLLQLHQEIVDFCEFVAPTETEQQMRATAVQGVSNVVKSIWPSSQVRVFGSFATGLYLPSSDVDVVVLNSGCQARHDRLKALAKALTRSGLAKNIQVIANARVPIIKFVETFSHIPFDISFDVANGPEAADFIKAAMEALPPLRPLCLVLKIFLQQRELNEVYQGGIGSYALLVMLLTHLQMHPSKRRQSSRGQAYPLESNLGILLVDFLDLYGRNLNVKDVGVSCRSGGRFYSKRDRGFSDLKRPHLLSVEDPQLPENDIGKNSYAIQKVRSAFLMAHRSLTSLHDNSNNDVGFLSRIVRLDEKLVGRKVPLTPTLSELPLRRPRQRGTQLELEVEPESYVVGDGTFSNSESDEAPKFKTPKAVHRGRWHEDEEGDDFPRGDSVDGHLSKKAKKAKKYKEVVRDKDAHTGFHFTCDRSRDSAYTPQQDLNNGSLGKKWRQGESFVSDQNLHGKYTGSKSKQLPSTPETLVLEEGEVKLGRRARKREEFRKYQEFKAAKAQQDGLSDPRKQVYGSAENENVNGSAKDEAKSAGRSKGRKSEYTHWNDGPESMDNNERSHHKSSRFRESPARSRGMDGKDRSDGSELTQRLVVTKPSHKKIKYG